MQVFTRSKICPDQCKRGLNTLADPGERSGGPGPPFFLDQTEARRAEKKIFKTAFPLSQGLDDCHPPPPPLPSLSEGLDPPL